MSHYPSTAELASFRRAIAVRMPHYNEQASRPDSRHPVEIHPARGAWADERSSGIGYSGGSPTAPFLMHEADGGPFPMGYAVSCAWADAYDHSWARKAAGAMRSRAYDEGAGAYGFWHPHDAAASAAFYMERSMGCPFYYGNTR